MEYRYKIDEFSNWLSKLTTRNECGVVVGLPRAGVSRNLGEVVRVLDKPGNFLRLLDCRLFSGDGKFNLDQMDKELDDWYLDEVKYVVVQGIEKSEYGQEVALLNFLSSNRQKRAKKINFIIHIESAYLLDFEEEIKKIDQDYWDTSFWVSYASEGKEFDDLIKQNETRFGLDINDKQVKEMFRLSGGCPYILKELVRQLADMGKSAIDEKIMATGKTIWSDFRRSVVYDFKSGRVYKDKKKVEFYQKLNLLDNKGKLVSTVLTMALDEINFVAIPSFRNEKLWVENVEIGNDFNHLELSVVKTLLEEKRLERDRIAEMFYGKDRAMGVSEYSIDKLMSNIRKKLGEYGVDKDFIKTLKGYGYAI